MNDRTRQIKADMKAIAKGPALIERALEVARRDATNVIPLPRREVEHTSHQISAAIEAMGERLNPSRPLNPREAAEHQRMIDELLADQVSETHEEHERRVANYHDRVAEARVADLPTNVAKLPETPLERYRRAYRIETDMQAGIVRDPYEVHWLAGYQKSAEYRSQQKTHEDFGDAYLS